MSRRRSCLDERGDCHGKLPQHPVYIGEGLTGVRRPPVRSKANEGAGAVHCLAMQPQARFAERHLPSHQLCCARLHCFAMRASVQRNDEPALASRRPHGGSAFRRTDAWNGLGEAPVERNAEPGETCEACKACGGLPRSCNRTILTNRICNTTELKDVYLSLD